MKIRRYYAKTIREALQKVRSEQGPDSVILSNRESADGIELLVAVDFDEVVNKAAESNAEVITIPAEKTAAPVKSSATPSRPAVRTTTDSTPKKGIEELRQIVAARQAESAQQELIRTIEAELKQLRMAIKKEATEEPALQDLRRELGDIRGLLSETRGKASATAHTVSGIPDIQQDIRKLQELMERQADQIAWNDITDRNPVQTRLLRRLMQMDLSPKLCKQLVAEMQEPGNVEHAWRHVLAKLAGKLPVCPDDVIRQGGVVALHGSTGAGKTTTLAKLAARYAVSHGASNVALVTMDNHRLAAHVQLRTYAEILGIPMYVAVDAADLQARLAELSSRKLVLIDTAGLSQHDKRLASQLELFSNDALNISNYLVMACTTAGIVQQEIIERYSHMRLAGAILTKVDEAGTLGSVLSLLIKHHLPVAYLCDGQRVPEDIFAARAYQIVSRNVALMQRQERATPADTERGTPSKAGTHV